MQTFSSFGKAVYTSSNVNCRITQTQVLRLWLEPFQSMTFCYDFCFHVSWSYVTGDDAETKSHEAQHQMK